MPVRRAKTEKLILRNEFAAGDIVVMTAAVRDLHLAYPGKFVTDVRTPCREIWENNPFLTPLEEKTKHVREILCEVPLIQRSNQTPCHYLEAYSEFLGEKLGLRIKTTAFHGDIHLSERERSWYSQVHELTGEDTPFWLIVAGGKRDTTVKWWSTTRYQEVVDHFRGKIQFVQVGEDFDHHPPLRGVIDLRGKTDMRQLIRLVYHSQGVLCGVTCAMHLAAAVERKDHGGRDRPCVVVAGGREPPHWEAYPSHQLIHTNGMVPCSGGGCWRSRVKPLGDGDPRDNPENLCLKVVGELPKCMDLITADSVIERVTGYVEGGSAEYLTASQAKAAERAVTLPFVAIQSVGYTPPKQRKAWNGVYNSPNGSDVPSRAIGRATCTSEDSPDLQHTAANPLLTIVTLNDAAMAEIASVTSSLLARYARRHHYPFIRYQRSFEPDRHTSWSKLHAVKSALLSKQSPWVMWCDADVVIRNEAFEAHQLVEGEVADMVCASDHNGVNMGVFLMRNSEWSLRFLDTVLFLGELPTDPDGYDCLWEQSTVKHLLSHYPKVHSRVKVLPQKVLNSSLDTYQEGDFILHLSGLQNGERLHALNRLSGQGVHVRDSA